MGLLKVAVDKIPAEIFRAYDIRGNTKTALSAELVHDIGLAMGSELQAQGAKDCLVGRDGRLSSPALFAALKDGLQASGVNVFDIGLVPTPLLYFATATTAIKSGIMLTGSHNPKDDNGIKTVINGTTLSTEGVQHILTRLRLRDVVTGQGRDQPYPGIIEAYVKDVAAKIKLQRPLKVVIDAGNGATGVVAPELFKALGCDVTALYCDVDGNFPNHHPDPSKPENVEALTAKVQALKADIGIAFDGDGDRVGIVTPEGKLIYPDRQILFLAKDILKRYPGATIVYDVKCSMFMAPVIEQAGGVPLMYKTGHSLLKAKILELKGPMGGEMSGHIFFKDRWYGFDDGMYAGARMLEILSRDTRTTDAVFADIPESLSTPELQIAILEAKKASFMAELINKASFPGATLITIDGLRVEFADGFGLVRASNTTPVLTVRFEGESETSLKRIQQLFHDLLLSVDATLKLPF